MKLRIKKRESNTKSFRASVEKKANEAGKTSRAKRILRASTTPFKSLKKISKKEIHLSRKKADDGKFLFKSRTVTPSYFKNSFKELKNVTWPSRRESFRLTFAVLIFSISFGIVIAAVDFGLDKLFKGVILK